MRTARPFPPGEKRVAPSRRTTAARLRPQVNSPCRRPRNSKIGDDEDEKSTQDGEVPMRRLKLGSWIAAVTMLSGAAGAWGLPRHWRGPTDGGMAEVNRVNLVTRTSWPPGLTYLLPELRVPTVTVERASSPPSPPIETRGVVWIWRAQAAVTDVRASVERR